MQPYSTIALENILSNFINTTTTKYNFSPITNGLINTTYLVTENKTPKYILQQINSAVFLDTNALMQNITNVVAALQQDNYTKVVYLKTIDHKSYLSTTNGNWRLMHYIKDSIVYTTTKNPTIAFEAGKIIGTFHAILQNENTTKYVDTISDFMDLEVRKKQFLYALKNTTKERKINAKKAIEITNSFFSILAPLQQQKIPVRICHNDTKLNNILFSKLEHKALCLIDLDTVMKGHFFYDFGDAIRTIVNTAVEDEKGLSKITFNKKLFIAFLNGISAKTNFLTNTEIKTLPLGVIYMPFIHGLRALTDYLSGDKYFTISYKTQNLERSISLFTFAEKAFTELDVITNLIYDKYNLT